MKHLNSLVENFIMTLLLKSQKSNPNQLARDKTFLRVSLWPQGRGLSRGSQPRVGPTAAAPLRRLRRLPVS